MLEIAIAHKVLARCKNRFEMMCIPSGERMYEALIVPPHFSVTHCGLTKSIPHVYHRLQDGGLLLTISRDIEEAFRIPIALTTIRQHLFPSQIYEVTAEEVAYCNRHFTVEEKERYYKMRCKYINDVLLYLHENDLLSEEKKKTLLAILEELECERGALSCTAA